MELQVFYIWAATTAFKLLLTYGYHSTDFEVHRNWLAITHSLPLSQWYFESTSVWTLDYPPFFAYFEKLLSIPAALVDPEMVKINNLDYKQASCVVFQRVSVVVSDLVFAFAVYKWSKLSNKPVATFLLNYLNLGLFMIDNLHFQYNSMMYGLFILAVYYIQVKQYYRSAFYFAVLLNFKHIYLYSAPAFGVFYLTQVVFTTKSPGTVFFRFAWQTIMITAVSFLPFIVTGQLSQIGSRLFPFDRGLVHDYMAANVWELYVIVNKYVVGVIQWLQTGQKPTFEYDVDADLAFNKKMSLACYLVVLIPVVISMFKKLDRDNFLDYLALVNFISFNFGFHVHEKAILLVTIPLGLSILSKQETKQVLRFKLLKVVAFWTFLPLIYTPRESVIKRLLFMLDILITEHLIPTKQVKTWIETFYKWALRATYALILLFELFSLFYVEILNRQNEDLAYKTNVLLLPTIAAVINQFVFIEFFVTLIV